MQETSRGRPRAAGTGSVDAHSGAQANIKVLHISGYTKTTIMRKDLLMEGISFLQEPFTTVELSCKVREVLDSKA